MTVVGIVVEYNPFHNGHLYQVRQIKRLFPDALIVVVMSGCWTQRGEPALFNKWVRAEMALHNGVDLVFELPVVFAVQSAEGFAHGAISVLEGTNLVDYLCFGSESGSLRQLQAAADKLREEPPVFKKKIKAFLKKGFSYPRAFSASLEEQILQPNNILGIEYLKALAALNSKITPVTIKRYKTGYHDAKFKGSFAGATAIRKAFCKGETEGIIKVVPEASWNLMEEAKKMGLGPVFYNAFSSLILGLLRRNQRGNLKELPGLEKGFHSLLYKSRNKPDLGSLVRSLKSKRYTLTRIQRVLVHLLLNNSKKELEDYNLHGPQYLRLLGFTGRGEKLLSAVKNKGDLPLVTRPSAYLKSAVSSYTGKQMLQKDILASDIYFLGQPKGHQGAADFHFPVIKNK